jgi:hypothetical protein
MTVVCLFLKEIYMIIDSCFQELIKLIGKNLERDLTITVLIRLP